MSDHTLEPERTETGWRLRIPVSREHVWVEKQTVIYEEVDISREGEEPTIPLRTEVISGEVPANPTPTIEPLG